MLLNYFKNSQKGNGKSSNLQGYTIIEVVAAQLMVGILATMSLPNLLSHVDKSRQAEAKTFLGTMNKLQQVYYAENNTLADNLEKLGFISNNTNKFNYSVEYQKNQALHHGNYKNNAKYSLISAVCINNNFLTVIPPQENINQVIDCTLLSNNNSSPINNINNPINNNPINNNPINNNPINNNPINNNPVNNNPVNNNPVNNNPINNNPVNNNPVNNNPINNNPINNSPSNNTDYETVTGDDILNNEDNIILIGDNNLEEENQDKNNKDKNKDKNDKDKVTVCHNGHEITISKAALKAHLDHGDTLGECK